MGFDGKVLIRGSEEDIFAYPQHFVDKSQLGLSVTDVFDYSITKNPIVRTVIERKGTALILHEAFIWMLSSYITEVLYPKSSIESSRTAKCFQK